MSEQVPPGSLPLTVLDVGKPAILRIDTVTDWTAPIGGTFYVNGLPVRVEAGDNLQSRLYEVLEFTGIELHRHPTDGTSYLVTRMAGSDQVIDIKGNPLLLSAMGIGFKTFAEGSDAKIGGPILPSEPAGPAVLNLNPLLTDDFVFPTGGTIVITVDGVPQSFTINSGDTWGTVKDAIDTHTLGVTVVGNTLVSDETGATVTLSLLSTNAASDTLLDYFIDLSANPNTATGANAIPAQPAQPAILEMNSFPSNDTVFTEGGDLTFTINGTPHTFTVTAGTTEWGDLKTFINGIPGITIVDDGTTFKIVSNATGTGASIALPDNPANDALLTQLLIDPDNNSVTGANAIPAEPARPATLNLIQPTNVPLPTGSNLVLTVNGTPHTIPIDALPASPPTKDDVIAFITGTPGIPGVTVINDGTGFTITTTTAGAAASLSLTTTNAASNAFLAHLLTPIANNTATGTDPTLPTPGTLQLLDINERAIPGTTLAVAVTGNQVNVRGTGGEDIRFNLQVRVDPSNPPQLIFGDVAETMIKDNIPLDLSFAFREFGPLRLQIGPSHNNAIDIQIPRLNAETLGLVEYVGGIRRSLLLYTTVEGATAAIGIMDKAINTVSAARSRLGAFQNRLESTVRSLDVAAENTETSRSRVKDTDMARESTRFATYNVMFQAAQAMLGQANQRPQQLLALLQ
jgi:flagellin